MSVFNGTVRNATVNPGYWDVEWDADIVSGVLITVDGIGEATTSSKPGHNRVTIPGSAKYGNAQHIVCVEEGNY